MKYQIDTIPVWDAVRHECECPFCLLQKKLDDKYTDYYLGDSIMQSHIRVRINSTGFCASHYEKMLASDRKLSLGLVTTTHMNEVLESIDPHMNAILNDDKDSKKQDKAIDAMIESINSTNDKCVICEDIERDIDRYIYTYIYLYKNDPEFVDEIKKSKGFCLTHFGQLIEMSQKHIHGKNKSEFLKTIVGLQKENIKRINQEVQWFCDKFDYRNADKPWGNSKDSLPRMINKLSGKIPSKK